MYLVDTWTKTLLGTVHASECSLALLAERGSGGVGGALGGGDDGKSGAQDKRGWSSRKASGRSKKGARANGRRRALVPGAVPAAGRARATRRAHEWERPSAMLVAVVMSDTSGVGACHIFDRGIAPNSHWTNAPIAELAVDERAPALHRAVRQQDT